MVPSLSLAVAVIVTAVLMVTLALLAGAVMAQVGAALVVGTVTLISFDLGDSLPA